MPAANRNTNQLVKPVHLRADSPLATALCKSALLAALSVSAPTVGWSQTVDPFIPANKESAPAPAVNVVPSAGAQYDPFNTPPGSATNNVAPSNPARPTGAPGSPPAVSPVQYEYPQPAGAAPAQSPAPGVGASPAAPPMTAYPNSGVGGEYPATNYQAPATAPGASLPPQQPVGAGGYPVTMPGAGVGYPISGNPPANGAAMATDGAPTGPASPSAILASAKPIQSAEIVARVAGRPVLAAEVSLGVDEMLNQNADKIPVSQRENVRRALMQKNLEKLIEGKLLYADALRSIPKENMPTIEKRLEAEFEKRQLPTLMANTKSSTRAELDTKLRVYGSSVLLQQQTFAERAMGAQWLREHMIVNEDVNQSELVEYYQAHAEDFAFEAQARWEELVVRFDKTPDKGEAYRLIASWGNSVLQGAPFAEVAKTNSQGVTASEGGVYDWTTRGSLVSAELNRALFTLPVGALSQIIEVNTGFHIIRVIERRDAGRQAFLEVQDDIRKKIVDARKDVAEKEYLEKLKREIPVWTIFDDEKKAATASAVSGDNRYGTPVYLGRGKSHAHESLFY